MTPADLQQALAPLTAQLQGRALVLYLLPQGSIVFTPAATRSGPSP